MDLPRHPLDAHQEGRLLILAGPSGVGKSSVVHSLKSLIPNLFFSVSVTTRSPREGEKSGEDYFFVSSEEFDKLIAQHELLEWAWIHGGLQRSGTPAEPIRNALAADLPVLVEVDLAGAVEVKQALPWARSIFLMPPHWNELKSRLIHRGSETHASLARRLHTARIEMMHSARFDYVVINHDIAQTAQFMASLLEPVSGQNDI